MKKDFEAFEYELFMKNIIDAFSNEEWDTYNVSEELVYTIFDVIHGCPEQNHIEVKTFDVLRNHLNNGLGSKDLNRGIESFKPVDYNTRLRIIR